MPELLSLTKEKLSEMSGLEVKDISDAGLAAANAEYKTLNPEPAAVASTETSSAGAETKDATKTGKGASPAAPEWKHPDKWEEHYYDRKSLDELDPHAAFTDESHTFHGLVKKIYGDPQRDESHPFNKQASDLRSQASRAAEEARQTKIKLEAAEAQLTQLSNQPFADKDNQPEQEMFGGIRPDPESTSGYSNEKGEIVPAFRYQMAITDYQRKQGERRTAIETQRRAHETDLAELTAEYDKVVADYTELAKAQPGLDTGKLMKAFAPVDREGKLNADFRGAKPLDTVHILKAEEAGGWNKYLAGPVDTAVKAEADRWRGLITKAGLRLDAVEAGTALSNGNSSPVTVPVGSQHIYTAEEITAMTPEQYNALKGKGAFEGILPQKSSAW